MPIRWDSLIARHAARELARELEREQLDAIRFDRSARDVLLVFHARTLLWRLHPRRGYLAFGPATEVLEGDYRLRGRVVAVEAPPDERLLTFELATRRKGSAGLVVELMGNQWNAYVTEGEARTVRHVLWKRSPARGVTVGQPYQPPRPLERAGLEGDVTLDGWVDALGQTPEAERPRALVRTFAWTSPINARFLLEPQNGRDGLAGGYERWRALADADRPPEPVLLDCDSGPQPYPFPLSEAHSPAASLLAAFGSCAQLALARGDAPVTAAIGPALRARLERQVRLLRRRVRRLSQELEGAEDPKGLRATGDLILARYAEIPEGAAVARLSGFDGAEVVVQLDPGDPPHVSAAKYYGRATKSERAQERLPSLVAAAEVQLAEMEALLERAISGDADADEVARALGAPASSTAPSGTETSLPYRTFRSSGGLEIRVGRGARYNDDLTFRNSSPGDVWLHARHTAGAHVILRWPGLGRPPARDLKEAAALAALHSKARTSGSVPVDWTLRKYVRKPRKAPPGMVLPDRVETLFVEPDASLLEKLSEGGPGRR